MAQETENYTTPPDGTTFLEFCNRCCERCRIVHWLGTENPPVADDQGGYCEQDLLERHPLSASCPLCQQLSHFVPVDFEDVSVILTLSRLDTVKEDPYRSDDKVPYDVLSVRFSAADVMDYERENTFINFALVDMLGGQQYEVKARSIEPFVNWQAVRKWIGHCETNHGLCAGLSEKAPVPGLKIIDCVTGAVEPFLDNASPYVALSYVWGEAQDAQGDYPQTVLESMEAVLALGLRYLWVDRICIDQKDSIQKSTQIRMMDQIYFRAYLTIISCSDDAEQGLPGMRKLPRDSQRSLWLGDYMLKHIYEPALSVARSRWRTRAWTYQEGLMSRRKLFFTEQGVALWCGSMYYEEGVSRSLPDIDEPREDLFPRAMDMVISGSLSPSFEDVIWEYSRREVTFEHDSLNACLGVLNYLGYKHLWGVVIWEESISMGLCWSSLMKYRARALEREAFPSWSWARWRFPVFVHLPRHPSSIASIKTHLPSGEEIDILHDTRYKGNLGAICSGKMLRITGTFVASRFIAVERSVGINCYIIPSCACGADIKMRANIDINPSSIESAIAYLDGIEALEVTPLYKHAKGRFSGQFLLVKSHMGAYRRIGVGRCDYNITGLRVDHVCEEPERFEVGVVPLKGCYTKTIDLI